ncbi:HvfC family RiPP maturation protein [Thermomonas flagellata]|uniref:HvfC family RiPP maturation protein n=1 Tax=Thermomonas flagellata TaxID=2888524 RepID=UPI001F034953|nr:putative DNA-binding domain-containing protein [Thermomonas flagellata]
MSTLERQLHAFAAHLRDPAAAPAPEGVPARRLAVYRDLVFHNLAGLLGSGFPVLRATLGEPAWPALVREFLRRHRSQTPLFPQLALEFVAFLGGEHADPARPWLGELAHYEWAEAGLQQSDAAVPPHDPDGDLLEGIPVLSPLAWPLAYRWPVHRIGPEWTPPADPPPEPTCLLLRRTPEGEVRFAQISPLLYRLLELVDACPGERGRDLLRRLAAETAQSEAMLEAQARPLLARLQGEGVLPGTRIA